MNDVWHISITKPPAALIGGHQVVQWNSDNIARQMFTVFIWQNIHSIMGRSVGVYPHLAISVQNCHHLIRIQRTDQITRSAQWQGLATDYLFDILRTHILLSQRQLQMLIFATYGTGLEGTFPIKLRRTNIHRVDRNSLSFSPWWKVSDLKDKSIYFSFSFPLKCNSSIPSEEKQTSTTSFRHFIVTLM